MVYDFNDLDSVLDKLNNYFDTITKGVSKMKGKQLRFSKTFWLALAQAVAGLITVFFSDNPGLDAVGGLAVVKSAIDILVRMRTSQPIRAI